MHTTGQFVEFLRSVFGDCKVTGQGDRCNVSVVCPICRERKGHTYQNTKLAIKVDSHVVKCWVCGYKSRSIVPLLRRYKPELLQAYITQFGGSKNLSDVVSDEQLTALSLPQGFTLLAEQHPEDCPWYVRQAVSYLQSRGLTDEDLWRWRIGVTIQDERYKGRVIVPSFDSHGKLNFFTGRSCRVGVHPRYMNPDTDKDDVVFNELNIDWSEELTIVEGPFDLMKCNDNATCLLGKELSEDSALFRGIVLNNTPVVLCLDSGASESMMTIGNLLQHYGIAVKVLSNPPGVKDPGEMTRTRFVDLLRSATVVFDDSSYLLYRVMNI